MIGFWKSIGAIPRGFEQAGPAQPYPTTVPSDDKPSNYSWTSEMSLDKITWREEDGYDLSQLTYDSPIELKNPVWEPIDDVFRSSSPNYSACFQGF